MYWRFAMLRRLTCLFLVVLSAAAMAQHSEIPEPLRGWESWVLRDLPGHSCPLLHASRAAQAGGYACAWPQRLDLTVDARGLSFRGGATLYSEDWLPLPGSRALWPGTVQVGGRVWPVLEHAGAPALRLPAGVHRIEGRIDWPNRPNYLPLPTLYAWTTLAVDGEVRIAPERTAEGLWLGLPRERTADNAAIDALSIEVFRQARDGVPMLLETRLRLNVSGSLRELALGAILPVDFEPMRLESTLEAGLHPDRGLLLLLRPGVHTVTVHARARTALPALTAVAASEPWPTSELWSFAGDPALRTLELSGARSVDPLQEDIPGEWQHLPAWRISGGAALGTELRSRGLSDAGHARLSLQREAWLDFHTRNLQLRDQITGTTGGLQRLQQTPPWTLLRAELDGVPQPLSAAEGGATGVELRGVRLSLQASARVPATGSLRVSGWDQTFDSVQTTLHLPPGRLLLAAPGADRAPATWIANWNLLDLFLVLLTSMLLGRLLGRAWGLLALALLAVAYPDYPVLLLMLAGAAAAQLLREAVGDAGAFARLTGAVRNGLLLGLVIVALPFIAGQLRLAIYPQLELHQVGGADASRYGLQSRMENLAYDAPTSAAGIAGRLMQRDRTAELDSAQMMVEPAAPAVMSPAPPAAAEISQRALAGVGEPDWSWRSYTLVWNGPVVPAQELRLIIVPRWLTALLRVLSVAALAALLWRWSRRAWPPDDTPASSSKAPAPGKGAATAAIAAALLLPLLLQPAGHARADTATIPSPEHLQALRDWLLRPPACAPHCVELPAAALDLQARSLSLMLDIHVEEPAGLALPRAHPNWQLRAVIVNGEPATALRQEGEQAWLWLERGIYRIELRADLPPATQLALQFARPPRSISLSAVSGWTAAGISDGRLAGDTVELRFEAPAAAGEPDAPSLSQRGLNAQPFFRIERALHLGNEWRLQTRVQRVAPAGGNLTVAVPLWPGENPLDESLTVQDGAVQLTLPAGTQTRQWESRLAPANRLAVTAGPLADRSETWQLSSSGLWRVQASGTPLVGIMDPGGSQRYRPLPEETLTLEISPVVALEGPWLAADRASLAVQLGRRTAEYTLTASLRATRAGTHTLRLPEGADLLDITLDGRPQNLRPEDGLLRLSLAAGIQQLAVRWRQPGDLGLLWRSAAPDLGIGAANVSIDVALSDGRWLLWTRGPLLGPAVLYWAALAVMLLIAVGLSRTGRTPLRLRHWLLLTLGFSTLSWIALIFVVGWLLAVDWRERAGPTLDGQQRNGIQIGLGILTALAIIVLISVIPAGLLGQPEMQVVGNGSSSAYLRWFSDRTEPLLPTVTLLSAPLWLYRIAILLWAVWLAASLLGWLRWTWQAMGTGGYWWRKEVADGAGV
jgi:hypothetical protein